MPDHGQATATIRAAVGDQARVVAFQSQPESDQCRPASVKRHETHGAIVFLGAGHGPDATLAEVRAHLTALGSAP